MHSVHDRIQLQDIHAGDRGRDKIPDGSHDGTLGIPRDDCGGGRFSITDRIRIRMDADHNVFHVFHRTEGRLKGCHQRDEYFTNFNGCNLHERNPPMFVFFIIDRNARIRKSLLFSQSSVR